MTFYTEEDKAHVHAQFDEMVELLNTFYKNSNGVDTDLGDCAFTYALAKEASDNKTVTLYYDEDNELWKVTVLHTDSMEEHIVYASNTFSKIDLLLVFTNNYTLIILE